jgi:hypothetical protein
MPGMRSTGSAPATLINRSEAPVGRDLVEPRPDEPAASRPPTLRHARTSDSCTASSAISSATGGNCHGIEDADAPNRVRCPCHGLTGRCQHAVPGQPYHRRTLSLPHIGHDTVSDVGITMTHTYMPHCAGQRLRTVRPVAAAAPPRHRRPTDLGPVARDSRLSRDLCPRSRDTVPVGQRGGDGDLGCKGGGC